MNSILRDRQPTVVHIDTDKIRATKGLQEYFALPPMVLRACYAVPRASQSHISQPSRQHTEALELDQGANGEHDRHRDASDSKFWIAGKALEAARAESGFDDSWEVRWPFRASKAADDWEGREFLLTHLYSLLDINTTSNTSPLLLLPPPSLSSLDEQAQYTQIAFETLNVPGFSILPAPLASLYALNAVTGLILHVGRSESTVFVIVDSIVRWDSCVTVPVGGQACEELLEEGLLKDGLLEQQLRALAQETEGVEWSEENKRKWVKEVEDFVWDECTSEDIEILGAGGGKAVIQQAAGEEGDDTFDVAKKLIEDAQPQQANTSHKSKKQLAAIAANAAKAATDAASKAAAEAAAAIAADVIVITIPSFPEKEITLGQVRHRIADPLLKGINETLPEAMGRAVASEGLSVGERMAVWEGVAVVGEMAKFKSFGQAVITYLSPFLLSSTDLPSDIQPSKVRLLSIPEYFTNFRNSTNELAPFLGGSMLGKVVFGESAGKHYISKVDYNAKGPAAIYTITSQET